MSILAIIPARGGSKGIKKKNIAPLKNKPLLHYTVAPAVELQRQGVLARAILSTDDAEIAAVGRELGIEVPFLRPSEFATDTAPSIGVILHALDFYEACGERFEAILLLQPTSPLRNAEDIRGAVELFEKYPNDSLISAYKEETINDLIMYHSDGNYAAPLNADHNKGVRRQDHGKVYIRNGAMYLIKADYVRQHQRTICERPLLYKMPKSRSINIDTGEDLRLAENLL